MNYADIKWRDIANGDGIRISIFVSGCTHKCPGCFNEPYQSFEYGKEFTKIEEIAILQNLDLPYIKGLSLLGGEPFQNVNGLLLLLKKVRSLFRRHNQEDPLRPKTVWAYTGYLFEDILRDESKRELLECIDVLVDGPFIQEELDLRLQFRGSANQRIIDVNASLEKGEIVLLSKYN